MSFDLEAKRAELEALKKENSYHEEKEKVEKEIKEQKKKKRERGFFHQILKELK